MGNELHEWPTIAVAIEDADYLPLKRGTGVNSDKKILGSDIIAQLQGGGGVAGGLIYGSVTWVSGLIFDVSEARYIIQGVTYTSPPIQLTLGVADGSNPRIDVIKVSASSVASIQAGTPAADPAKPEIDPLTELELTFVTVATGATTPLGVIIQTLYAEDAGDPTEWDATENTAGARITLDSVADPWLGTKSILFNAATNQDTATLTAGAGNDLTVGTLAVLELHIKPTAWTASSLRVAFFKGNKRVSNWVQISNNNYGFDTSDANYQAIGIPAADFAFSATTADSCRLQILTGTSITAYVDQIRVQAGLTIINNYIGLTEEDLINSARTFLAKQGFGGGLEIKDATDLTKIADFDISGVSTATTRTLTVPDEDVTLGKPLEHLVIAPFGQTDDLVVGDLQFDWELTKSYTLAEIPSMFVSTAPTGTGITVDITADGATIFSTLLTIDATEKTSTTAATPAVLSTTVLPAGTIMGINIDVVGSTIAGAGPKFTFYWRRT